MFLFFLKDAIVSSTRRIISHTQQRELCDKLADEYLSPSILFPMDWLLKPKIRKRGEKWWVHILSSKQREKSARSTVSNFNTPFYFSSSSSQLQHPWRMLDGISWSHRQPAARRLLSPQKHTHEKFPRRLSQTITADGPRKSTTRSHVDLNIKNLRHQI